MLILGGKLSWKTMCSNTTNENHNNTLVTSIILDCDADLSSNVLGLKRLLQGMTIRIEFIKLKTTLTISILGYIGPNFVWVLVSNHISWICWQNVDMSTKMLTSTSGLTKSCYIDLRSSKCLEASDVNKNVDMSTFSPNRIHVNMQNDCETSIVVANSI